jgi:hypothetical protein
LMSLRFVDDKLARVGKGEHGVKYCSAAGAGESSEKASFNTEDAEIREEEGTEAESSGAETQILPGSHVGAQDKRVRQPPRRKADPSRCSG